ncbi:aromatic amino acid lyase, partial [Clostridium cochlearium]
MKNIKEVVLTGNDLTLEELVLVAREGYKVSLSEEAKKNVLESRKIIDDIVENEKVVYGVTTGFGEFCNVSISKEDCKTLQENLIRSHACGYGPKFSTDIVRAIMLTRA